jgi:uncharacterized membrane protein
MNKLIKIAAVALALSAPLASFAQSQPLTRAEVRAQLVQLEKAGYNPGHLSDTTYPQDIQAAQARVDAQNGYGGVSDSTVQSGSGIAVQHDVGSTFAHH